MSRRPLILALAALALAAPGAAAATRPHRVASAPVTSGPVLAGHRVYWAQGAGREALVVRAARSGRGPATVWSRAKPADGNQQFVVKLAHSGSLVDVLWREVEGGTGCKPATLTRDLALAGRRVFSIVEQDSCSPVQQRFTLHVRKVSDSTDVALADGSAPLAALSAAGDYVAWQTQADHGGDPITVYDVTTGAVAYTVSDPSLRIGRDQVVVDRAGRLAVTLFDPSASTVGARYDLEWFSRTHPEGVPIPGLFATDAPIAFASGKIAFQRPQGAGVSELTLTSLAGATHTLGTFHAGRLDLVGFDWDGRHAVWAQRHPGHDADIELR